MRRDRLTARTLAFLISYLAASAPAAEPVKVWDHRFGGGGAERGARLCATPDGGYLVAGTSASGAGGDRSQPSRGSDDFWVVRLAANGAKVWDRRFGGAGLDSLSTALPTADGGFLLAGRSTSEAGGDKSQASRGGWDFWVVKIDASGNKLWDRRFGGADDDLCEDAVRAPGGGFLLVGSSASAAGGDKSQASRGDRDYWVVRIDSSGNKLWDRRFGGVGGDYPFGGRATADGGFVLCGASDSDAGGDKTEDGRGGPDFWIVKIGPAGARQWDRTVGGGSLDRAWAVLQTASGGYAVGGESASGVGGDKSQPSHGDRDFWLVRLDPGGNVLWERGFGGSDADRAMDLVQTPDSGFLLTGHSASPMGGDVTEPSRGGADYWVLKVDWQGNRLWDRRFGGGQDDIAARVCPVADGQFLLAGISASGATGDRSEETRGNDDYWVVRVTDLDACTTLAFDKRFGGASHDDLSVAAATPDGGAILGGVSRSGAEGDRSQPSRGSNDFWIVKTGPFGAKQWDKRFGGSGNDSLCGVQPTADGGYILGGGSDSPAGGDKSHNSRGGLDYWIVKIAANGAKQWDRRFGGTDDDYLTSLRQTPEGGFVLAGYSFSGAAGDKSQASRGWSDYWVVKTDASGNKLWDRRFGSTGIDYLRSVLVLEDGGFLLAGQSDASAGGDKSHACRGAQDYWVVRTDAGGNKLWDRTYGGSGSDKVSAAIQLRNGDLLLGGESDSPVSGEQTQDSRGLADYWIVRTDASGTKLWDRRFGGRNWDLQTDLAQTADGGLLMGGKSCSDKGGDVSQATRGHYDYWVVKTDSRGNKQWDRRVGGAGEERLRAVAQTADGGYLVAGGTPSDAGGDVSQASRGGFDFWMVKLRDLEKYNVGRRHDPMAVVSASMRWHARTLFGVPLQDNVQWGGAGMVPVAGDFNGDGRFDLAAFKPSQKKWYVRSALGATLATDVEWGAAGATPVAGDYDGDGRWDLCCYNPATSKWNVRSLAGKVIASGVAWGAAGAIPVAGDYNGDGRYDLGYFSPATATWSVRSVLGVTLAAGVAWGWNGAIPVPGDYNGDGKFDLAVFDPGAGTWYIRTLAGTTIAWARSWGWPGAVPVAGDFDGDRTYDLAVIDPATGNWHIQTLAGATLAADMPCGPAGSTPVGIK